MTTLYFNFGTPQTGLSAVVSPIIGDGLIVNIPQVPGSAAAKVTFSSVSAAISTSSVAAKAVANGVAGSLAIPYAAGAVRCSSVVGDWEVKA